MSKVKSNSNTATANSMLEKALGAVTTKNADVLSQSKIFNKQDYLQTKVPAINIALGGALDAGIRSGIITIAGPSKHFKSNIGLVLVAAYMKHNPDAICLFFDAEFGITQAYLKAMGVNPERVVHIPVKNVEELKFEMVSQLELYKRGDKVIVFVDSIGNLASKKEVEDAIDQKSVADMTRAKALKSLSRVITPYFQLLDIPGVFINHTLMSIEMFSKEVMTGGCVVEGTMIQMADGSLKPVESVQPGDLVKTMVGPKEVTHAWNPNTLAEGTPECIEVEFEDGYRVICSETHRFLVMRGDIPVWVQADQLQPDDDCVLV